MEVFWFEPVDRTAGRDADHSRSGEGNEMSYWQLRERERSTRGDRVLFSSVGLWEGFLGVKITRIPYHFCRM